MMEKTLSSFALLREIVNTGFIIFPRDANLSKPMASFELLITFHNRTKCRDVIRIQELNETHDTLRKLVKLDRLLEGLQCWKSTTKTANLILNKTSSFH